MSATPDLLNLFIEPAVALLYFLAVILLSQAALFMALGQRMRGSRETAAARYAFASLGVVLAWLVLMVGALVVLITGQQADLILPPLDRAVNAVVVLLVGWAFLSANQFMRQPSATGAHVATPIPGQRETAMRGITAFFAVASIVVVAGYAFTAFQWFNTGQGDFNVSVYNLAWAISLTAISVLCFLLILVRFRSTVDAPLKMLFFVFILAGCVHTLVMQLNGALRGDDLGAMRLAFLAAMPFLPIAVYRLVVERLTAHADARSSQIAPATPSPASGQMAEAEREAPALLRALGTMIEHDEPDQIPQQIAQAIATSLKSDVAALVVLDDAEYADVVAAYDNVQQKPIAAMALKIDEQPTLSAAILERAQHALSSDKNLNELVDLYTRLDIQKIGPAYFQPLNRESGVIGAIIVGLPYTQRELRSNELKMLGGIAPIATRLLGISRRAQRDKLESQDKAVQAVVESSGTPIEPITNTNRAEMSRNLELARQQIGDLTAKVRDLQIELDYERSRIAELSEDDPEGLTISQRMTRLSSERSQLEVEREKLMLALQEAQTRLATFSADDQQVFETMIKTLQKERDDLLLQKDNLETQLTDIRQHGQAPAPTVLREMLTNLSEEKARLSVERDQLKDHLTSVQDQLRALGVEDDPGGLAALFVKLTDERSQYKALAERAAQERDTLLAERKKIENSIAQEAERATRIVAMETDLRRLAEDREALVRQRDSLRQERTATQSERDKWEAQRARMVADMASMNSELEEAIFERNRAVSERKKLAEERSTLLTERDRLSAQSKALQSERDQLMARIEGNRDVLQQLGDEGIGQMRAMIDQLTQERSDLERRLLNTQADARAIEESLALAEAKLARSAAAPPSAYQLGSEESEVMLSAAQELRTPMSSVAGYVDLLLNESVGILGALQREFLQRVRANVDRLGALLEDFIRVTALDTGQVKFQPIQVDMIDTLDDAITATREQFRSRGITIKMDTPNRLPSLKGDQDALQQILIQLLSNAYLASPSESEIRVQMKLERNFEFKRDGISEQLGDSILLAVTDHGGGIPPEEQSRVFSRLYRASNPLIQGLGDTGVGLSIARALTEAHGGRIWLESTMGVGSTFKLVLPLSGANWGEHPEVKPAAAQG